MHRHKKPLRKRRTRTGINCVPRWLTGGLEFVHLDEEHWAGAKEEAEFRANLEQRRLRWLRLSLRDHPRRDRRALLLHFFRGCSFTQCSRKLNVHPATAARAVRRSIARLQRDARTRPELWPPESPFGPKP